MASANLLIQTHWTDFEAYWDIISRPEISVIQKAQAYFDRIVMVYGACPENCIIEQFALEHGVMTFEGDLLNVRNRFRSCMNTFGMKHAVRILGHQFMADCRFMRHCLAVLETQQMDYVMLPRDFDLKFGGDVFSTGFLDKVEAFEGPITAGDGGYPRSLTFCPWAAADLYPEAFKMVEMTDVPQYGIKEFESIRSIINCFYPERSPASDMAAYRFAAFLLKDSCGNVADIACGQGDGAALLSQTCNQVRGVDYSQTVIDENCKRFGHIENLEFRCGDVSNGDLFAPRSLDAVVSIHSMEHFTDDDGFLANCAHWLKTNGQMVLEVPLLMTYPFPTIRRPLGEKHIREYMVDTLTAKCASHFKVEYVFGVSRGNYLPVQKARNAVMLLLGSKI